MTVLLAVAALLLLSGSYLVVRTLIELDRADAGPVRPGAAAERGRGQQPRAA